MHTIGYVKEIVGLAFAVSPDGTERILTQGDLIYPSETTRVSPDARLLLALQDNQDLLLEDGQSWPAVEAMEQSAYPGSQEQNSSSEFIKSGALQGIDPTQLSEAPAAGEEQSGPLLPENEGSNTVTIERTADEINPSAGYETIGYRDPFPELLEEEWPGNRPSDPAIPPGNAENINILLNEASITDHGNGSLNFSLGSDPLTRIAFDHNLNNLTRDSDGLIGDEIIWIRTSDNEIIGQVDGATAITLTLTPDLSTGSASVQAVLSDNFKHPDASGENSLDLGSIAVIATDSDGDSARGHVSVTVVDDIPTLTLTGDNSVVEGGAITGNWDSHFGADSTGTLSVQYGGNNYQLDSNIDTGKGILRISSDGSWLFTPVNSLNHTQTHEISFGLQIIDTDGDSRTLEHTIAVTDGTGPGSAEDIQLNLDEDSITDNDSGNLNFSLGSDALSSIVFDNDLSSLIRNSDGLVGDEITWIRNSDTEIIGQVDGATAITLTLTPDLSTGSASVQAVLSDNFKHPDASGENSLDLGSIAVVATDSDGDSARGHVSVTVVDDIPTLTLTGDNSVVEGGAITGNWDSHFGADSTGTLSVQYGGNNYQLDSNIDTGKGILRISSDGSWLFTPVNSLNHTQTHEISFGLQIIDTDGDSRTLEHTIAVTDGTGPGSAEDIQLNLDEDSITDNDSGNLNFSLGSDALSNIVFDNDLSSLIRNSDGLSGDEITWIRNSDTEIIGQVDGATAITLTLTPDLPTGSASVQAVLSDNFKHPDASGENSLDLGSIAVVATDNDGDSAQSHVSVTVVDDIPTPEAHTNISESTIAFDTNLMLMLDVSNSMEEQDFDGMTRMENMIKSCLTLLETYESYGDVMVNIVSFATDADQVSGGWVDIPTAKQLLMGLTVDGYTNYNSALNSMISSFNANTADMISGAQTISYFMSDGESWLGGPVNEQAWESFVTDNNIKSHALALGPDTSLDFLDSIAYDGRGSGSDMDAIQITDTSQLETMIVTTVNSPALTGDLLAASSTGADGGWVSTVAVDGINYHYNAQSNAGWVTGGSSAGSFSAATQSWTILTSSGSTLAVNMLNGEYVYSPSSSATSSIKEEMGYSITDGDGDTASNTFTLTVNHNPPPQVVTDDFIITNQTTIEIPDWALLQNDSGFYSGSQYISAVLNPVDGTATDNSNSITFTDNATPDGRFDYTNTANSNPDNATVFVDRADGVNLQGTYHDEIIIAGSTDDTILAAAGKDILIAGAGNDTMTGGTHRDSFVWRQGDEGSLASPAEDRITDFATTWNGAEVSDVLHLSDLLQGETEHTLSNYLSFTSVNSGTDTLINLSVTGNGNVTQRILLEGIDLTSAGTLTNDQIINNLLDHNNLIVDQ